MNKNTNNASWKGHLSMFCANAMWGLMSPMAKLVIIGGAVVTICLDQYADIRGDDSCRIHTQGTHNCEKGIGHSVGSHQFYRCMCHIPCLYSHRARATEIETHYRPECIIMCSRLLPALSLGVWTLSIWLNILISH